MPILFSEAFTMAGRGGIPGFVPMAANHCGNGIFELSSMYCTVGFARVADNRVMQGNFTPAFPQNRT